MSVQWRALVLALIVPAATVAGTSIAQASCAVLLGPGGIPTSNNDRLARVHTASVLEGIADSDHGERLWDA